VHSTFAHRDYGERDADIPRSAPHTKQKNAGQAVQRKKWRCPSCRHRFRVPIGCDPELCPECGERRSSAPAAVKKPKILIERVDPFLEFLSSLTGRRFSSVRLIRRSIQVAIVIAVFIIGFAILEPFFSAERQTPAEADQHEKDASELLGTNPRAVQGALPKREDIEPVGSNSQIGAARVPQSLPPIAPPVIARRNLPKTYGAQPGEDRDLIAVRAWLKENQDRRGWEETKWWPSKAVDGDLVTYAGLMTSDRVARLQYRMRDEEGAAAVRDDIFVFRENKVRVVPRGDNWWWDEWGGWTRLIIQGARRLLPANELEQLARIEGGTKSLPTAPTGKSGNSKPGQSSSDLSRRQGGRLAKTNRTTRARQLAAARLKKRGPPSPWWAKYADEADVDLIRTWLADNVTDWEEVRWWKPRDFMLYRSPTNPQRSMVVPIDDPSKRFGYVAGGGLPADRVTREHVCRIKIRVNKQTKEAKIEDRLFQVANGKVEPILDPQRKRHEWRYFPETAGARPQPSM
jgi:hypothetical protein